MARRIMITSGKGGVGKTTVTANLGTALALSGKKVCLLDADFGLRNLDIPLGLTNRIIFDISDYISGRCELQHLLIKDKNLSNLSLIPCGGKIYDLAPLKHIVQQVSEEYDYVLIDSPAGIESGFQHASSLADEAIVVVTPHRTSIQDADRVIGILEELMPTEPTFIINMSNEQKNQPQNTITKRDINNVLQLKCLGEIPLDTNIIRSVELGRPIVLDSQFDKGGNFHNIARNLELNQYESFLQPPVKKKKLKNSFFSRLRKI